MAEFVIHLWASKPPIAESMHAPKQLGTGFVASDGVGLGGGVGVPRNAIMKSGNP